MKQEDPFESRALVYCQGALGTTNGKTAHGLIRRSKRYKVLAVIDRTHSGADAGDVIGDGACGIPVLPEVRPAIEWARSQDTPATHLVVGLAPDGGRLSQQGRRDIRIAIDAGLDIHAGLHDFLTDDSDLVAAAREAGVALVDVRKPPPRRKLHFFSGKIEQVDSLKIAMLGTDSAVGKRTTAWLLVDALAAAGFTSELIGTGQTAWLQGSRYGIVLDSLVNDFVSGEIEHAVWSAWRNRTPDALVIEGQGSLMNPAYPGGFEILAAGRPDVVILQHAPSRVTYDGFPHHPLHPIERQIEAVQILSDKPVVALTINHENLDPEATRKACRELESQTGLPVLDPLRDGAERLVEVLRPYLDARKKP
jgi:uncharacterized NAD-dependent epimerase/dehydratase family protein